MTGIRFINKNGTSVDLATVRKRFFESAADAEVDLDFAMHVWDEAVRGGASDRRLIERLCEVEIVGYEADFQS